MVLSVATAGAVLAGGMVGSGFAQGGGEGLAGPDAEALADPVIQEQVAREHEAAEAAAARRQTADEVAARQRSRAEYQDLTPDQARRLALERFPELLAAPATAPLELPPGAEVERYYGTHAALIDPPGVEVDSEATHVEPGTAPATDPGGVVQSTTPLRAADEQGDLRPVDSELTDRGPYLEPANATVEAELPDDLSQGIEVPEFDLALVPSGAAAAASGELAADDTVFYADLGGAEDTDFLAAATPTGAEAMWQLRSARSPERLALDLELAAGAALEPTFEGLGARIVREGETTAIVTPPIAFDADGQSVPVSMDVSGSGLELQIEHRAGDWKYPLLIDPVIEYWFWAEFNPTIPGWHWEDSCVQTGLPCPRFLQGGNYAIASQSFDNTFYWQSEYAQWVFAAPPDTYVEQAEFWWQEHNHSPGDSACTVQGIYDRVPPGLGWQLGYAWVDPGGWAEPYPGTPYVRCNPYSVNVVSQGVGRHLGDNGGSDPTGEDENGAVFQLFMDYSKHRVGAYNFMHQANIHLFDRYNPGFTSTKPASQGWRDDTLPGGGGPAQGPTEVYSQTIRVSDRGLGVKYIDLWVPDAQGGSTQNRRTHPCPGAWRGACPASWQQTFNYTLPEGLNTLVGGGFDMGWRYPQQDYRWQQPIDRSPPDLNLSGFLKEREGTVVPDGIHNLHIAATDGSNTSASTKRSGVRSIAVFVDDQQAYSDQQTCPSGSCPMTRDWTLNTALLSTGDHEISVRATDQLGHDRYSDDVIVTVRRPDTNISVSPADAVPFADATLEFSSAVTAATFQCRLDAGSWQTCTSPKTYTGLTDGSHAVDVRSVSGSMTDPVAAAESWQIDPGATPTFEGAVGEHDESVDAYNAERVEYKGGPFGIDIPYEEELAWCHSHEVSGSDCNDWNNDRKDAERDTELLFTQQLAGSDQTRGNAFRHAYWVAAMINTNTDLRYKALRFANFHERGVYDGGPGISEDAKFASRMDIMNNRGGWALATHEKVDNHNQEYFCGRLRRAAKNQNAAKMRLDRNPYWYRLPRPSERVEVFFRKINHAFTGQVVEVIPYEDCAHVS